MVLRCIQWTAASPRIHLQFSKVGIRIALLEESNGELPSLWEPSHPEWISSGPLPSSCRRDTGASLRLLQSAVPGILPSSSKAGQSKNKNQFAILAFAQCAGNPCGRHRNHRRPSRSTSTPTGATTTSHSSPFETAAVPAVQLAVDSPPASKYLGKDDSLNLWQESLCVRNLW
jgi:hypothetical protein